MFGCLAALGCSSSQEKAGGAGGTDESAVAHQPVASRSPAVAQTPLVEDAGSDAAPTDASGKPTHPLLLASGQYNATDLAVTATDVYWVRCANPNGYVPSVPTSAETAPSVNYVQCIYTGA
jgi:hypothetical protein